MISREVRLDINLRFRPPTSVHHVLNGLRAWAAGPQSDVVPGSTGLYRKSAGEFLDILRIKDANGIIPSEKLWKAYVDVTQRFPNLLNENLVRELDAFCFKILPEKTNPPQNDLLRMLADFEGRWQRYATATDDVGKWEKAETFQKLKKTWEDAVLEQHNFETEIAVQKEKVAAAEKGLQEVSQLQVRLDLVRERPPADLIMLINPASEATFAQQMQNAWEADRGGDLLRKLWRSKNSPWIISISSEFDSATRVAFPIAMTMSGLVRGTARFPEDLWMTHTAPHLSTMCTHKVEEDGDKLVLKRIPNSKETPLWIVTANKKTVPNHNGIFTQDFRGLVKLLLKESAVLRRPDQWEVGGSN